MNFHAYSINKDIPIPLYFQLKQILLDELNKGNLKPGDAIPTEEDFCQIFKISRTTVRQAVSSLAMEGYLQRMKSKGTFVSKPKIKTDLFDPYGVYNIEVQKLNMVPIMRVCGIELVAADYKVAKRLQTKEGEKVILISRKRYADDIVMGYIETYLRYPLCGFVMDVNRLEQNSLYEILADTSETRIRKIIRTMEACIATDTEAKQLNIKPGEAVSYWQNIGYSYELPIIYDAIKYRGDKNMLTIELSFN